MLGLDEESVLCAGGVVEGCTACFQGPCTTIHGRASSGLAACMQTCWHHKRLLAGAATLSRCCSHMVFMLNIEGSNEGTGQKARGMLNLIDLAGSERLGRSGVSGERLKETQNINKSLSGACARLFHSIIACWGRQVGTSLLCVWRFCACTSGGEVSAKLAGCSCRWLSQQR